jgi:enoyl-CoA hydratase/carnithine racemase
VVEAEEAARMGLVNRVLPAEDLLDHALGYATDIATATSPASARTAKAQLYADLHGDVGFAVARSEALLEQMVRGPDFAEGVAAWRERRAPQWPEARP